MRISPGRRAVFAAAGRLCVACLTGAGLVSSPAAVNAGAVNRVDGPSLLNVGQTVGGLADATVGAVLYVDAASGNDATAVRGDPSRPFLTFPAAMAAHTANDIIRLGPGTFDGGTNTLTLLPGASIVGESESSTIITGNVQHTFSLFGLIQGTSSNTLANITITEPGTRNRFGCPVSYWKDSRMYFVTLKGVADTMINTARIGTNESYGCYFETEWDFSIGGYGLWRFFDCTFSSPTNIAQLAYGICPSPGANAELDFYTCSFLTSNNYVGVSASNMTLSARGPGSVVKLYGCRFESTGAALVQTNGGVVYADAATTYDPASVIGTVTPAFDDPIMVSLNANPFTVLQAWVNFARPNRDGLTLDTLVDLGDGFSVSNQAVTLHVGGADVTFTLDKNGRGITPYGICRFTYIGKPHVWRIRANLNRGDWQGSWAGRGLLNATVSEPGISVIMPISLLIGNEVFTGYTALRYVAESGEFGIAW